MAYEPVVPSDSRLFMRMPLQRNFVHGAVFWDVIDFAVWILETALLLVYLLSWNMMCISNVAGN